MAERGTHEVQTSGGHTVVLNNYITGREQRAIQDVFLTKIQVGNIAGKPELGASAFEASTINEAQDVAIRTVVVSLDGSSENILERILDLPSDQSGEIIAAVNEVTDAKKK